VKRVSWIVLSYFYILEETRTPKGGDDWGDNSGGSGLVANGRGTLVP